MNIKYLHRLIINLFTNHYKLSFHKTISNIQYPSLLIYIVFHIELDPTFYQIHHCYV